MWKRSRRFPEREREGVKCFSSRDLCELTFSGALPIIAVSKLPFSARLFLPPPTFISLREGVWG